MTEEEELKFIRDVNERMWTFLDGRGRVLLLAEYLDRASQEWKSDHGGPLNTGEEDDVIATIALRWYLNRGGSLEQLSAFAERLRDRIIARPAWQEMLDTQAEFLRYWTTFCDTPPPQEWLDRAMMA
jgi:hypothetical protein